MKSKDSYTYKYSPTISLAKKWLLHEIKLKINFRRDKFINKYDKNDLLHKQCNIYGYRSILSFHFKHLFSFLSVGLSFLSFNVY